MSIAAGCSESSKTSAGAMEINGIPLIHSSQPGNAEKGVLKAACMDNLLEKRETSGGGKKTTGKKEASKGSGQ